ncbi:MAG: hypothetical protein M3M86_03100 [Thermoproteota archaeon]|nr:hypothetical protein [Thermoproteota archaeon]
MILAISLRKEATTTAIDTARNKTPKAFLVSAADNCNNEDAVAFNLNHHHHHQQQHHYHDDCPTWVM